MKYGRCEKEVELGLRARGIEVVPQVKVPGEGNANYLIDLGCFPLAVEVHTDRNPPRSRYNFRERSTWLMRTGWALAYIWMRKKQEVTDDGIDALVDYFYELEAGKPERFRVYDFEGNIIERGDLELSYNLRQDYQYSDRHTFYPRRRVARKPWPPHLGDDEPVNNDPKHFTVPEFSGEPAPPEKPGDEAPPEPIDDEDDDDGPEVFLTVPEFR